MEQNNLLNDVMDYQQDVLATTGQRLANYLIDLVVYYGLVVAIMALLGSGGMVSMEDEASLGAYYLIFFGIFFAYYTLLEGSSKGKTVGKMVTRTKVVTESGDRVDYGTAFVRTLIRMVPFEFLSVFFGDRMWHDKWTKTKLIKE